MLPKRARTERNKARPFEDKQGSRFTEAARNSIRRLATVDVHPWIIVDREGDNRDILVALDEMPCLYTIRATWDRRIGPHHDSPKLRKTLENAPICATARVEIPRSGSRAARTVSLDVRAANATVHFKAQQHPRGELNLFAVLIREKGKHGDKRDAIDWLLYTNVPIVTADDALKVVEAYRARWRIEEFHKTWKSGACNVETAQLRSFQAVAKWATLLSAVATRIERLKYLARTKPEAPISVELEPIEIEALLIERKARERKNTKLPAMPTVAAATEWIAEMGGWMGLKTSGPPGSITIARGLQILAVYVRALNDVRNGITPISPRR
jgi:hypothetical protein